MRRLHYIVCQLHRHHISAVRSALTRARRPLVTMPAAPSCTYPVSDQAHLKQCGLLVKSPNDRRDYRPLTLDNGIRVLLISDKQQSADLTKHEEKLSAAGLCINVGSFSDPHDLPGLAHFLEHMVFMGSTKYPDENDFQAFVSKHGGMYNAYTDADKTVFFFGIRQNQFQFALDKFANFFSESLLKEEAVDREIEAVDKEFCLKKLHDAPRKLQMYATAVKPGYPMSRFTCGNRQTLKTTPLENGIDAHAKLREFYKRMYSSKYMTLAVQSKDSLDDLEAWVRESFTAIKDNGMENPKFDNFTEPFDTPDFYKLYKMVPVNKMHQIEVIWHLPPVRHLYHVKPLRYLGWLLGHEGNGSILAYLKTKGWALGLVAGNYGHGYDSNTIFSSFVVSVMLTDAGYQNYEKVLNVIFAYIKMLQTSGPQEHIYKEIQSTEECNFRFLEQGSPISYVSGVCTRMRSYPVHEYLTGGALMFSYQPDVIAEFTNLLVPEKAGLCLMSNDITDEADQVEPIFGTQYQKMDIPEEWVKEWKNIEPLKELHIPQLNEFIATNFELQDINCDLSTETPNVLFEDEYSKVYFRQDDKFKVPKAHYNFHLISPYVTESAERMALLDLYVNLLDFNLSEVAYAASEAELHYDVGSAITGLLLKFRGYNHKLLKLVDIVLHHATNFTCEEEDFKNMQRQLRKTYHNSLIRPQSSVYELRLKLLRSKYWTVQDKSSVINNVTREDLMKFAAEISLELYVESYITGNVTEKEALDLNDLVKNKLKYKPLPKDQIPKPRVFQLPEGTSLCRVKSPLKDDDNCVITNYYQVGPGRTVRDMCLGAILGMVMREPCFNILRTKLQLGYAVQATNHNTDQILAYSVTVCSKQSQFNLDVLNEHMENFLQEFDQILEKMTDEEFNEQLQALINLKKTEDASLMVKVSRDWSEITQRRYMFNRLQLEIDELEKLTRLEVLEYFRQYASVKDSGPFRKLSVQVEAQSGAEKVQGEIKAESAPALQSAPGAEKKEEGTTEDENEFRLNLLHVDDTSITDVDSFQKKMELYEYIEMDV